MSHAFQKKKKNMEVNSIETTALWILTEWWRQLKYFWNFHPHLGKMNPFWRAYFSTGLVQPPTSYESALGAHHGTYCSVQTPTSSPWPAPVTPLALLAASVAQRWMRRKVGWTAPGGRWLWVEGSKWCSNYCRPLAEMVGVQLGVPKIN